ncbi:hypothetical protein KZ368_04890 [Glaesserella parasuis]|uniref:hypothetical protein n=1 Tax=Glaesserella parasuis TaxID=738 RepID=UPI0021BD96AC|nr:hypothetical protein [Glaesserella parasuis]MCT8559609.1 hypothetical protein [Glaesserella parasuis]MCT8571350.1 hypothetical protein [Glaesserella parasuis]MCT8582351.1 hypothetical protein [Glaesserella parasuis]MCT8586323.1 hypothetical protein [Glaesserella parasuis]
MCTLMQKDVLIELIATAQADLSKRLELPLNDDQIYLSRLRNEIYRSEPDVLDFQLLSTQVKQISDKYHYLPLI